MATPENFNSRERSDLEVMRKQERDEQLSSEKQPEELSSEIRAHTDRAAQLEKQAKVYREQKSILEEYGAWQSLREELAKKGFPESLQTTAEQKSAALMDNWERLNGLHATEKVSDLETELSNSQEFRARMEEVRQELDHELQVKEKLMKRGADTSAELIQKETAFPKGQFEALGNALRDYLR